MTLHDQLQKARREINSAPGKWMWCVYSWSQGSCQSISSGEWVFVTDEQIEAGKKPDANGMTARYTKTKKWWEEQPTHESFHQAAIDLHEMCFPKGPAI